MQIFTTQPYSKTKTPFNYQDARNAAELAKNNNIQLFIHTHYFINLRRPVNKANLYNRKLLIDDLERGKYLYAISVVVHVGKFKYKKWSHERK